MEYDKITEIRSLLDAYFDGETTLGQERRLREYFLSNDVSSDLLHAKAMFAGFDKAAGMAKFGAVAREEGNACVNVAREAEKPGIDFMPKIRKTHVNIVRDAMEVHTPAASISYNKKGRVGKVRMAVSIAAALMVAVGAAWMLNFDEKPTVYCYVNGEPVTDMDIAVRQAHMAARLLQGGARASADGIARLSEVGKSIERLNSEMQMPESGNK